MKSNYKKFGDYIRLVDERNKDDRVTRLLGVSIEKKFIESIANTVGTDMSVYKIVRKGQFAYGPVTSRNGDKVSIALLQEEECIISSSYTVFEIIDTTKLLPEYLNLWFKRPEFDRYARFHSHGSAREIFDWDEMCNVELPIPELDEQKKIVEAYSIIEKRIEIKRQINDNLASSLQTTFSKLFVKEYTPNEWSKGHLKDILFLVHDHIKAEEVGGLPYLPIDTIPIKELIVNQYRDSSEALSSLIKYCKNDILIGAMRVYFHRVVIAPCDGVTRTTCFVLRPYQEEYLYYALCLCNQPSSIQYANSTSKGSTMPYAVWEDGFSELEILIPPIDDLRQFNNMAKNIIEIMYKNVEEINKLKSLLPLLQTRLSR